MKIRVLTVMLLVSLFAGGVFAAEQEKAAEKEEAKSIDKVDDLPPMKRSYWRRYWKTFAQNYVLFNEEYLFIAGYDDKYPSSLGKTVRDVLRDNRDGHMVRAKNYRGVETRQKVAMPEVEAQVLAMVLPDLSVGHYGWVYSARIEEIVSEDEMIVSEIRRINCENLHEQINEERERINNKINNWRLSEEIVDYQFKIRKELCSGTHDVFWTRVRLKGFETKGLAPSMTWRGAKNGGIHLAILGVSGQGRDRGQRTYNNDGGMRVRYENGSSGRMLVGVPADKLEEGIAEEDFKALIRKRGFTIESFVDLVVSERRSSSSSFKSKVVEAIENAPEKE